MKNYKVPILFISLLLLPMVLFAMLSHVGLRHPLESKGLKNVFFLEDSANEVEIVFFGYAGCSFICPASLTKAGKVLDGLKQENKNALVGGIFIDINAETQLQRSEAYGSFFSPNFAGYNTNHEELDLIKESFKINSTQSVVNPAEIFHTDHFFLLKRGEDKWFIHRVLANTISEEILEIEVRKALDQL